MARHKAVWVYWGIVAGGLARYYCHHCDATVLHKPGDPEPEEVMHD